MSRPHQASGKFHILLAEDNLGDVLLTRAALDALAHPIELHHVENGEDCLDFLKRTGRFATAPTPDLLLLDLNMPRLDGREVMAHIAAEPTLRQLPVVILTTSAAAEDIRQMYDLRCSSYIVKPLDFDAFQHAIAVMADYWFSVVALPSRT